ncbi:ABC transporter ATP-binding protein [Gordonia sp. CPCC 206044]|uniref:ABC transporter ATP-binding protein n=1 Tax=Gordonia sp. CPCC 206044 TaxID=3140793 RepID=UPI003AF39A7B
MVLAADRVSWRRGGTRVLDEISLDVTPGETLGILGPNGSGKSSFLNVLGGLVRPDRGSVCLDGVDLRRMRRRHVARRVAMVSQHATTDIDISVRDVVALGRIPHGSFLGADRASERIVDEAIRRTGLADKAARKWHTLSGGEQQRAQIARALAQEPQELLLDEPTNHLDIAHQLDLLGLVARLPVTAYVALHDLNLAAMFCDRVLVLRRGRAVALGPPDQVLTAALIADVYGVHADLVDTGGPAPSVVYRASVRPGPPDPVLLSAEPAEIGASRDLRSAHE